MNKNKTLWKVTVAMYEHGADGQERRVRKEITLGPTATMSKREAIRAARPIIDQANATAFNPTTKQKNTTFEQFADVWERDYLPTYKPSTRPSMRGHAKKLKQFFGPKEIRSIGAADVQRFVTTLTTEEYEPKTIRNFWITLRLILSAAVNQGYVDNVVHKPKLPRVFRKQARRFTTEEVGRILAAADADDNALALYWTAAETGMRLGELAGIRTGAFANGPNHDSYLQVSETVWNGRVGTPKTPSALRIIHVSAQLRDLLGSLSSAWAPFRPGIANDRKRKLQPLLNQLGIQKAGFHAFRHFNASLMDSLRIPLKVRQERLGHASTGMLTLDVYTHSDTEDHIEAARLIGNAIELAMRSVSLTTEQQKGPAGSVQQAQSNQLENGCGGQI